MDKHDKEKILGYFEQVTKEDPEISAAVAAIKTLLQFIEHNKLETLSEMRDRLKKAITTLTTDIENSYTSITSGCDLFLRFITLTNLQHSDFQECQKILVERGKIFLERISNSRQKIARIAHPFITDGTTILTHSRSRVVLQVLKEASLNRKRFNVLVTESLPDRSGEKTCKELSELNIPTTLILDASVGYVMERVDLVLVGAEGVVESGGIINKIGTFSAAISAKAMNKPFYVVSESFKFVRLYPLNQTDLPSEYKYSSSVLKNENKNLEKEHPSVDYTPPSYISLLFTDLGVLTPSAVSDELIQLYK